MTDNEIPNDGTLSARVRRTRLAVLDLVERNQQQHGAELAENILRRTTMTATELDVQTTVIDRLREAGIPVTGLARNDASRASQARTALRTTATRLSDPSNQVRDLVSTKSLASAIESAEHLANRRARSIESAFSSYRLDQRPVGIDDVATDGIEPLRLALQIGRLQRILNSEAPVNAEDILVKYDEFVAARQEWEHLQPAIAEARRRISPQMEAFFRMVRNGAPWTTLTEEVRTWLDEGANGDDFVLVRRDHLT